MRLLRWLFGGPKSGPVRQDYDRGASASTLANSKAVSDGLRHGSPEAARAMARHRHSQRRGGRGESDR